MAFLRRINCHFCGTRSQYSKSSGIPEFQCTSCEAVNFLDSKGNIMDTPASIVAQTQHQPAELRPAFKTFTHDLPETLNHQQGQAFCNTCLHNQRIYMETLSNYLPDEDHPEYQKFEDALPKFKRELEARYPQICRKCAPKAQSKVNRADYYAATQNIGVMGRKTRARNGASIKGMRDDWGKWSMRLLLRLASLVYYASLLAQIAWHVYGMFATVSSQSTDDGVATDFAFDATPKDCVKQALSMRFDQACYGVFGTYMIRALLTSACLLWYNPGLKNWYHHTHRMSAVTGQREYFRMQLVMLAVRAEAYYNLSNPAVTAHLTTQQLLAAHGFMITFMALVQWISNRAITPIRFKLNMDNMMPRPEDRDVLGALAGPEDEAYDAQASSIPPSQLFARDRTAPFPISSLAPKRSTYQKFSTIPSPPPSDETDDEGDVDAMDMDWQPSLQSQMPGAKPDRTFRPRGATPPKPAKQQNVRSLYNHGSTQGGLGWSGVRDELFGIQNNLQLSVERKRIQDEERAKLRYQPPAELNPFRGRLPQAPMSMERKLRNPITQVSFKKAPVTKQQDFLAQMRSGIEQGKTFAKEQEQVKKQHAQAPLRGFQINDDDDDELSPAKMRTRGELQLKESSWKLPTDAPQATGLEDLFGGKSFSIADEPAISVAAAERRKRENSRLVMLGWWVLVPVVAIAAAWNVKVVRRTHDSIGKGKGRVDRAAEVATVALAQKLEKQNLESDKPPLRFPQSSTGMHSQETERGVHSERTEQGTEAGIMDVMGNPLSHLAVALSEGGDSLADEIAEVVRRCAPGRMPPFSAEELVVMALASTEVPMSVIGIADWVMDRFPYYANNNSVRQSHFKPTHKGTRSGMRGACSKMRNDCCFFHSLCAAVKNFEVPVDVVGEDSGEDSDEDGGYAMRFSANVYEEEGWLWETSTSGARVFLQSALQPASDSAKHFPFLQLPPELRNKVYELVLAFPPAGIYFDYDRPEGPPRAPSRKPRSMYVVSRSYDAVPGGCCDMEWYKTGLRCRPTTEILALLQVNKQIFREAMPIFYGINTFNCYNGNDLYTFLKTTPASRRKHIRHISFLHTPWDAQAVDPALRLLKQITHLQELDITIPEDDWRYEKNNRGYPKYPNFEKLPGLAMLRSINGLKSVRFHGDCKNIEADLAPEMAKPKPAKEGFNGTSKRKHGEAAAEDMGEGESRKAKKVAGKTKKAKTS